MIEYKDECVDCGLPCRGSSCSKSRVRTLICDNCAEETDRLYTYMGGEICFDCLKKAEPDEIDEFDELSEELLEEVRIIK